MDMSRLDRLPNLLTYLNMFFGFAAVTTLIRFSAGVGGSPAQAAWFILIAAVLDAMDGKLARRLKHQSRLGMELDSLSDVVSFGVAPSVLLYTIHFGGWGDKGSLWGLLGLLFAALPLVLGSFRLARFNAETGLESGKSPFFAGLPIPAAAVFIVSYVLFCLDLFGRVWAPGLAAVTALGSLLMISRVRFEGMPLLSFKRSGHNLNRLLLLLMVAGSILFLQSLALFPAVVGYLLYSLAAHLKQARLEELEDKDDLRDGSAL